VRFFFAGFNGFRSGQKSVNIEHYYFIITHQSLGSYRFFVQYIVI